MKNVDQFEGPTTRVNRGGVLPGVLLLLVALFVSGGQSRAEGTARHILILSAFNYNLPAASQTISGIESQLRERGGQGFAIDAEFLDLFRVTDPEHEARMAAFVREKYAARPPNAVVVLGSAALQFLMKHPGIVAPQIPVVFAGVSPAAYASLHPPSNITGVFFELNFEATLRLAESLQPSAKRLFVISGASALEDRAWQEAGRRTIERHQRQFETTFLFGRSYDELMTEIDRVPNDAIVIFLTFLIDGAGKPFTPREVVKEIARRSAAPVYGPYDTYLGAGVVGGFVETFESHGAAAANLVLAIDAGKDPASLPPKLNPTQAFRVDARAMARWGLKRGNLPTGSVVLFDEPSIWEQHRYLISAVALVIALLLAGVAALLVQLRRRRQAEHSLKESEDRMTFTAATANIGLWQFDRATEELWATDHCRKMFGLANDTPLTRERFIASVHPEDRRVAVGTLRGGSRGHSAVTDIRIVLPDDQIRWFRIRARAPPDDGSAPDQLSGMLVDITDQKAAESEAELQRQEVTHLMRVSVLGELSGAIAHEVNQPLTAILSNAQAALYLLDQESPDLAEVRDTLQDIVQEDNRAGEVVQRMRGLLKKGESRSEPVDLNEMVDSTTTLLRSELIGRRVMIETDLAAGLPIVLGDSVQLQQVLLNLVVNAMDAMASTPVEQRRLNIRTSRASNGNIQIQVKDNGPGIRPDDEKQVFAPFYTTKEHGLGLGLTICSTIVRKHGGTLNLRNDGAGGAVAEISLPARLKLMAAQ